MDEDILEVLMAVEEGESDVDSISAATGRTADETLEILDRLRNVGFLTFSERSEGFGGFHLSQSGRILLRLGTEEAFKRELTERLGGDPDSAS